MTGPTRTSWRGGGAKTKMRMDTMNVGTVRGKMDLIIDLKAMVQETRFTKELEPAAKGWAKRRGCSMTAEKCYSGRTGTGEGAVCILSKLQVQQVQMSGKHYIRGTSRCRASKEGRRHATAHRLRVWTRRQSWAGKSNCNMTCSWS